MLNLRGSVAVAVMLLSVAAAGGEIRRADTTAPALRFNAPMHLSSAPASLVAATLATLPPEEKPKTHWPWWLRILAVIGVFVFIRVVAGSVRKKPGTPGPS